MQVSVAEAGGELRVPYQTVAPGITRACQPQGRALPRSLRPCSLSVHREVAPLQKDAMPQPPTRKPWATARPSQPGITRLYLCGWQNENSVFFFSLGILTMHCKVCLPHGLKVLLCLWGPEEVGQMVLMKAGCFLGPFSTEQGGLQQFEWIEHSPSSVHYKYYCLKVRKKSEIITTSFSHNP